MIFMYIILFSPFGIFSALYPKNVLYDPWPTQMLPIPALDFKSFLKTLKAVSVLVWHFQNTPLIMSYFLWIVPIPTRHQILHSICYYFLSITFSRKFQIFQSDPKGNIHQSCLQAVSHNLLVDMRLSGGADFAFMLCKNGGQGKNDC